MHTLLHTQIIPATIDRQWIMPGEAGESRPVKLLILVPADELNDLSNKMLNDLARNACKLEPEDFKILPLGEGEMFSWSLIKAHYQPEYVLLSGLHPTQLGINALFAVNAVNNFGEIVFIVSASPAMMMQNQELKKALWKGALEELFKK